MKELHFYFQSLLIILALACALQGPHDTEFIFYALYMQFFLGVYQYGMSWFLMLKLKRTSHLLLIYFCLVHLYFLLGLFGGLGYVEWLDIKYLKILGSAAPWGLAIFFLVVIEDLLWKRVSTPKMNSL